MKITVLKKSELLILKALIKGLAAEGSRTRKFINKSVKERKDYYWNQKRSIGSTARYYLIAYGLLRGKSYQEIESNSNKEWMKYNFDFIRLSNILCKYGNYMDRKVWTPDNLKRLILTGSMEVTAKVQEVRNVG
jgi:hypothetical protein